jgi:uncharacterized protein
MRALVHAPEALSVNPSSPLAGRVSALHVHPIKSCAGIPVAEALLVETGLEFDRTWMVVDEQGEMLTQRDQPRMALVQPSLRTQDMVLRAPGMLALHLRLDTVEAPTRVRVWDDIVKAYDMGALAAQWFSDFLGRKVRVVRFDPDEKRLSEARWTGAVQAENTFADGFPLLVASSASLADLNQRLAARGQAAVGMERFRPNLVLDGLQPWDEDHIDEIEIDTPEGVVRLKLVKPCTRCMVPNVDPATGEATHEPGDTLAGFRADPRMDGALTFGMNAVVLSGFEHTLRRGQPLRASWAF